ncbi:MAG TPA: hypothetical protein VF590_00400 [Isosphaeraceae bacterium]|jgi:Spy/CpxP family protein refolding chaperone
MNRPLRALAAAALLSLGGLALVPTPAPAQEEAAPAEEGGGGSMWYGYIGTGVLAGAIVFAICKTARR